MTTPAEKVETPEVGSEEQLVQEQEALADEVFGTDEEIAKQAVEAEAEVPPSDEKPPAEGEKKDEEEKPPAEGEEKASEEKPPAEGEKTPEELAAEKKAAEEAEADPYKVPEDMKGRTRERFEKLTTDLKTSHETIEKQTGIIKGFRSVLEETGLTPKELQNTLNLGGMIKTDPKRAYQVLTGVVKDLASELGEVAPGTDPLEGYEDLRQRVADRELSVEDAKEIAQGRIRQTAEKKQQERNQQQTEEQKRTETQQGEFKGRVETAQESVGTFLKDQEKDPDYEKIGPHMVEAAKFAAENLAPEKWLGYIQGEYKKVKDIALEMVPSSNGSTPILDGGAPQGGKQEPQTLEQLADVML